MSIQEKLSSLKHAIENALSFADPEEVIKKAEAELKDALVSELNSLRADFEAFKAKFEPAADPQPVTVTEAAPAAEEPAPVTEPAAPAEGEASPAADQPAAPAA